MPKRYVEAQMLVESLTAEFEPAKYRDEYRVQVLDLIGRKAAGEDSSCWRWPVRGRRPWT